MSFEFHEKLPFFRHDQLLVSCRTLSPENQSIRDRKENLWRNSCQLSISLGSSSLMLGGCLLPRCKVIGRLKNHCQLIEDSGIRLIKHIDCFIQPLQLDVHWQCHWKDL